MENKLSTMSKYIEEAESVLLHTYNRFQVVFDHGEGVYLYDTDGKKYLDFTAGIAVFALGYKEKEFDEALKEQVDKLLHTSNYFYNVPATMAAKKITAVAGLERVFFTNSGAEAVEGAIKSAIKYAYTKKPGSDYEIIAMEKSFHGRTLGALAVTGTPKYREAFGSMDGNVKFATYNNLESVESLVNEKTCAIILEPVQGEGGIIPATEEFLMGIKKICEEKDIVLIFDEIQCGMGRTGSMFAWQKYGIKPDVMTIAKALGNGVPVGAFLLSEKIASSSLVPGDHGSTYGGNPFAGAAVNKVLDLFEKKHIIENVTNVGKYLEEQLTLLADSYDFIIENRGVGLMQALEFSKPVAPILSKTLEHGLVLINAGPNVIRFIPPLIITKNDVDLMISILKECLDA